MQGDLQLTYRELDESVDSASAPFPPELAMAIRK